MIDFFFHLNIASITITGMLPIGIQIGICLLAYLIRKA